MTSLVKVGNRLELTDVASPIAGRGTVADIRRRKKLLAPDKERGEAPIVFLNGGVREGEHKVVAEFIFYCIGVKDYRYYKVYNQRRHSLAHRFIIRGIGEPAINPGEGFVCSGGPLGLRLMWSREKMDMAWMEGEAVGFRKFSHRAEQHWGVPHPNLGYLGRVYKCSLATSYNMRTGIAKTIAAFLGVEHTRELPNMLAAS